MRRMPKPFAALAALLAVLLPFEQAHCAYMGLEKHASAVSQTAPSNHDCCAPADSHSPQPTKAPANCVCVQLPLGSLPAGIPAAHPPTAASAVTQPPTPATPPAASIGAPVLALDVGSPPLPVDLGAHGLRAPPRSV